MNYSNNKKFDKEVIWFILSRVGFNEWYRNGNFLVLFNKSYLKKIRLPVKKKEINEMELKEILKESNIDFEKFKEIYEKWNIK